LAAARRLVIRAVVAAPRRLGSCIAAKIAKSQHFTGECEEI
jgi:hypothetical protein